MRNGNGNGSTEFSYLNKMTTTIRFAEEALAIYPKQFGY
jgi:hypothetical protein